MLPGFLTTALELIIILDVCGAVVYFALSGLARSKKKDAESQIDPNQAAYGPQLQPCAAEGITSSLPLMTPRPGGSDPAIYAGIPRQPEPAQGFNLLAGFKHRISSFKSRFTYRPATGQQVEVRNMDDGHRKLGQILDSFREEA